MPTMLSRLFSACAARFWAASPNPGGFPHDDFTRSTVRDAQGAPVTVHHATTASFGRFAPLSHFGTRAAAEHRMQRTCQDDPHERGARTITAQLNIQNPIDLPDLGGHQYYQYEETLRAAGFLTEDEAAAIFAQPSGHSGGKDGYDDHDGWKSRLVDCLMAKGYDGFTYTNDVEDPGSTSYIVFRPEQVHVTAVTMLHQESLLQKIARTINPPARSPYVSANTL